MSDHYTYRITWSAEDAEHVGLCAEFPSLSWLAATPAEALSGIQRLVADSVADMRNNGEPVPEPMADRALQREVHRAGASGDAPLPGGHSSGGAGSEHESPGECPACEGRIARNRIGPTASDESGRVAQCYHNDRIMIASMQPTPPSPRCRAPQPR